MVEAMNGVVVEAGNCMEQAAIAFFLAIAGYPGKIIYLMNAADLDHAFVLVGDEDDALENGTVIDAWQKSENGKRLAESRWRGSTRFRICYKGDGENYLTRVQGRLGELDQEELEKAFAVTPKKFKIYDL